jgi:hypothetical protein
MLPHFCLEIIFLIPSLQFIVLYALVPVESSMNCAAMCSGKLKFLSFYVPKIAQKHVTN